VPFCDWAIHVEVKVEVDLGEVLVVVVLYHVAVALPTHRTMFSILVASHP